MPSASRVATKTVSSTKMALATAFLGVSAMAAAAAGIQLNKQSIFGNKNGPVPLTEQPAIVAEREVRASSLPNLYFNGEITSEITEDKDVLLKIPVANTDNPEVAPSLSTVPVTLQVRWKDVNEEWKTSNIPLKKIVPGESYEFHFSLPFVLFDEPQTIFFKLDPSGEVPESNEHDNEASYDYVFSKKTILQDANMPNLIVTDVLTQFTENPNEVQVKYTVKNIGKSLFGPKVSIGEKFGNQVGTNKTYSRVIDTLPGKEQTYVSVRQLPPGVQIDRVRVEVDTWDSVTELDETDNHQTVPLLQ